VTLDEAKQRALGLLVEYERTHDPETLSRAVEAYRELTDLLSRRDPDRAACLSNLGVALLRLVERTGDVTVIEEAAAAGRQAASIVPPDDPEFLVRQYNASQLLIRLFELSADLTILPDAARAARKALGAVGAEQPDRADMLLPLGDTLKSVYEWLGELSDLQLAVTAYRSARAALPPGNRRHAGCQTRLCVALRLVHERTDDLDGLREAVEAGRAAVEATPADDPNHAKFRVNLGNALRALYDRSADTEALREALETARDAVTAFPTGHADRATALNALAATLGLEYERTGELPILRQAVDACRDAVDAAQPPFLYLATYELNLANHLRMLADRVHDRSIAREAVAVGREALEAFASNDPERAKGQAVLSQALVVLAGLDDDSETLFEAVRLADDARDTTPYEHPAYVEHLTSLVNALMALYRQTRVRQFLDRAVHAASNAAASTPPDHPDRAAVLTNLCRVLEAAAQAGVTGLQLTQAERFARDAVEVTSPVDPQRATLLSNLGDLLALKAEQTGDPATARECVSVYASAARVTGASPIDRVSAAQRAASSAMLAGHRNQALALAETAVGLVPRMIVRDVERADRERRLRAASGLAATVAAAAISTGRPERAVELLEQARGLVLASTLETRSDLTELRSLAPDLATPFDELRRAVNALDHDSAALAGTVPAAELGARLRTLGATRERLNQEWDRLLDRIRQRDGLERFLQPRLIDELCEQAKSGPVVYLTVHEQRGHALIVRNDPDDRAHALPLDVTASTLATEVATLRAAQRAAVDQSRPARERRDAQRRVVDVLGRLWDNVTEPVLAHLGHTTAVQGNGPWPRIWWCPVGLFAFLPLHAAGHHTKGSRADSVMDRVISSYTPSIRALAYVRERPPAKSSSAVVIAVPDAPESPPLVSAAREADTVRELIPDAAVLPLPGTETDRDSVIEALRRHAIAHLACHGVADRSEPARSRLILHDHLSRPLTLHDITQLHLESAQLAYLSACSTTDSDPRQVDESTQLTAAFQLAGYRNVIGTLWPISDQTAAIVARDVYAALTSNGTTQPVLDMVAEALHRATRHQRDRTPAVPTRWAAYIHYGV
jgi:tetratricopeptide (TPR) repeat protein